MKFFTPKSEKVLFNPQSIYKGHQKTKYRGVDTMRCPFDYLLYQMLLFEVKPDLIIEIGTNKGGSALYLADLLQLIGNGLLHTIDIEKISNPLILNHPRIEIFTNGWEKYEFKDLSKYNKILVIEDSSHTYENTLAVMNKFSKIVTAGSYMIIEDGIINQLGLRAQYNGGPLRAIREFLAERDDFIIDREWTNFFGNNATFNVNGYLKKIL